MDRLTTTGRRLREWIGSHGVELRLAVRMTVAGVLAYAVAYLLAMPQGFWSVFTAVLVIQASVGGSLKMALDQLIGTVGGGAYGAVVATLIPHSGPVEVGVTLAIALAPLALVVALRPNLRIAPLTAVLVLFAGAGLHLAPFELAVDRVFEISIGSVVGIGVSLLFLPARAHSLLADSVGRTLALLSELLALLLGRALQMGDAEAIERLLESVHKSLPGLAAATDEAMRERRSHLTDAADPAPILRTVRRLRSDVVMVGRATTEPLPEPIAARLAPALARVSDTAVSFLRDSGAAFTARRTPPALDAVDAAFDLYAAEMAALRGAHTLQDQPSEAVECLFTLGFALEQLRRDFRDLASRIHELARPE